jgi:hypothetical protein
MPYGCRLEQALIQWMRHVRDRNVPLTGPLLQEKAKEFSLKLGDANFNASNGWLDRFKKRENLDFKAICGEAGSVDMNVVNNFTQNVLPSVLEPFQEKDIYNADETGLFWQLLPNKTLHFRNEKCTGGKQSKERISVLVAANMDGSEKLKLLVIGKSQNPRCFKNVKRLPVEYRNNRKGGFRHQAANKGMEKQ